MIYEESGLRIKFKQGYTIYKLDKEDIYKGLSHLMACVDFLVLANERIYLIEVKRIDYFYKESAGANIHTKLAKKFIDSLFLCNCLGICYREVIFCVVVNGKIDQINNLKEPTIKRLRNLSEKCNVKILILGPKEAEKHLSVFESIQVI